MTSPDLARLDDERHTWELRAQAALAVIRDAYLDEQADDANRAELRDRRAWAGLEHDEALAMIERIDDQRRPFVDAAHAAKEREAAELRASARPEADQRRDRWLEWFEGI